MKHEFRTDKTYLVGLNILNSYNAKGCEACNQKFNLGDTVVMAVGGWSDAYAKLIHRTDAVFDCKTGVYYDKKFFRGRQGKTPA